MLRATLVVSLVLLMIGTSLAQEEKKKRRAPPTPDKTMQVRSPATVDSFTPEAGAPGTVVTIKGQEFDNTTKVRFNGKQLAITAQTKTELKVKIPQGVVSDHFVITKAGFPDVTTDQTFHVVRPPAISSFSPTRGDAGTEVTIVGSNFLPSDKFVLGTTELESSSVQTTRAVVRIAGATGKLGVKRGAKVVAWSKTSFDVSGKGPVITSFAPQKGPKGTVVRISGKNFETGDSVELGGEKLAVRGRSATHIDVVISPKHFSGQFSLQGREGRRADASGSFTVVRPLAIKSFSPAFGGPRTRITVEGAGFAAGDGLSVGEAMLTVRTLSDSQIIAELPAGVATGPVCVRRGAQKVCARGKFEVTLAPVIINVTPAGGPPGAQVKIVGRNFLPDVSVLLSGQKLTIAKKKLPDELTVVIPQTARTGQLVIVTRAGTAQSPVPFQITQYAEVTSFFPLHAPAGAKLTIRGTSFHAGIKAQLGETELKVLERAEESMVVQIPKGTKAGKEKLILESYGKKITAKMTFTIDEAKADLSFTFAPTSGKRGTEVTLTLDPPTSGVLVFFDGRPLSKNELQAGKRYVVTVPSDARSGHFELEHSGQRYKAKVQFKVR
jgi:large repetitive protein